MTGSKVVTIGPADLDPRAEQHFVPMRDGVLLATDVYLGRDTRPRPAVLVRLPYDKSARYAFMPQLADHITDRGFVFVVQDVRGKFRSGGETMPCTTEVEDGYDTLEWLAGQLWCDGSVGMFGDSYYGYTQWAALASAHPALRAIAPGVTTADMALQRKRRPGAVFPLIQSDYVSHVWVDQNIHDFDVDWSIRPLANVFDDAFAAIGARSRAFDRVLSTWDDPADFGASWTRHPFNSNRIPVLHQVAWFDNVSPLAMRDFEAISSTPGQANYQYLLADARDHENYHLSDVPISLDKDHGEDEAALNRLIPHYLSPALDFFEWALRGRDAPAGLSHVNWFLGHDGWHRSHVWPPDRAEALDLFLSGSGATASEDGGDLSPTRTATSSTITWTHDPSDLVPSMVGDSFAFLREYPDERRVHARPDVLTFTSPEQTTPMDLAGPVALRVRVGTSAPSMQVHAKLLDVAPDGSARMITRGQVELESPDPDVLHEIYMGHTGYRVRPGHRLRLHLACSDFPLFIWNVGKAGNPWLATSGQRNEQELVIGGTHASHISLTILPAETPLTEES